MDPIADVEGAIADSLSASTLIESIIGVVQSSIGAAQSTLLESQYLAALPIIALEFKGLVNILLGAGEVFIGSLESLAFFVPDLFDGIFAIFTFSITWMMCLFKNLSSMQTCLFYYLLEATGQVLYLPIRVFLWVCYQIGFDLYPMESAFWNGVEEIDKVVMEFLGFHISHYPKDIRDKCYNCKRLKVSALINHATPLSDDIFNKLPKLLMPGFMHMAKGGEQLMNPFG